jgi:hypothetical protein
MVSLKLRRQQWSLSQLLVIALIIAVLLSSLYLFDAVRYSECSSSFVDTDVATLLPLLISSPAVVSTSLASKQSYGLFNDIPDQRWELIRRGAHEEHTYVPKDPSSRPRIQHDDLTLEYLSNLKVRKWTGDIYSQHLRSTANTLKHSLFTLEQTA